MAMRKVPSKKQPFRISSFALTSSTETVLERLSGDATDTVGRAVSDSAIIRALLRYAEEQSLQWARERLYPHLEKEMNAGVLWGKRKS
jgi:hypothetical protein